MILADTMLWFFVVVGLLISFNGIWLLSQAMWPGTVERTVEIHRHSMWKSFFIGLPVIVVGVIAFLAMSDSKNGGQAGLIGLVLIACLFLFSSVGVAGLAALFGERLNRKEIPESLWKLTMRGGIVLALSYLFPIAGQLVILPVSLIVGCGVTIRALWAMRSWKVVKVNVQKFPSETAADSLAAQASEKV